MYAVLYAFAYVALFIPSFILHLPSFVQRTQEQYLDKRNYIQWYFVTKIILTYCEKKLFYLVIEKKI